jgi:hypothetical protein
MLGIARIQFIEVLFAFLLIFPVATELNYFRTYVGIT